MATARKQQVDLTVTPYYHCMARCVRRAFLCGEDPLTGRSFEHRRGWVVQRCRDLSAIFAMDVCAYGVMNNHYHLILYVDVEQAKAWSDEEVIARWHLLFNGNPLSQKHQAGEVLLAEEQLQLADYIADWRCRLTNISWFMRCVNEYIARLANREDDCTGHFWESRFKSQALLDLHALLSCMAYVDLNPVRAGMASDLEEADFTSVQERLQELAKGQATATNPATETTVDLDTDAAAATDANTTTNSEATLPQPATLAPCQDHETAESTPIIPIGLMAYLALVRATGQAIRQPTPSALPEAVVATLQRLGINPDTFVSVVKNYRNLFSLAAGSVVELKRYNQHFGKRWSKGLRGSRLLNPRAA